MNDKSESEIVFSSRRHDESIPSLKNSKVERESLTAASDSTKKSPYHEGQSSDLNSSGRKANRKGSDESTNDIQSRKIDQFQKYNCEGFVRSGTKHDHLNSEEKRKDRVKKEIQNLETLLNEIQLKHSIDEKIDNMRNKVSSLSNNFDSSVKLGKGIHEKYQCIKQLAAGAEFVKLAHKSNKLNKRFVFYSETLEAICWRDPKSKIPKTKQMIYLAEIIRINEEFKATRAAKKFTTLKIDEECFFSLETKDRTFDLLAPNVETKKTWVKTLSLLMLMARNRLREGSSGSLHDSGLVGEREYEAVAKQFIGKIGNLQNEIEEIKQLCLSNEKKLKKNFLDLAEEALMKEADQAYRMSKAVRVLDNELQEVKDENQNLKVENFSVKKHLEVSHLQGRQLVSQLRSYNDEKKGIVDFIKQFQKKLLNCVEFLSLLDFEVHEKDGEQLVSTNDVTEGALLNEDFSNLDVFMNQMQVQFDTIMLRTNQMQKKYSDLQDRLKETAKLQELTEKDKETWTNKYNEIYALFNEAVMEKDKLSSEVNEFNGQLDHNIKENVKLKKEISELETQLNEVKKTSVSKDKDLQDMIGYAKKLQSNMETQFDELRKESTHSEMEKLNVLEDRYNMQIRRYENKIQENDRMINEFSDLVQSYETQMNEYVHEIDQKQAFIDDLTFSRDKLNQMIMEMEQKLKNNSKEKEMKTPTRRSTAHTSSQCEVSETIDSPRTDEAKVIKDILSTDKKVEIALNEKEEMHRQRLVEMEANLQSHSEEIKRLEEENKQYNVKVSQVKQHEELLKQKITRYHYKMKDIMQEGAKVRKHFKQLELYMSHWLNLIYLENVLMGVDETDSFSFTVFSKEVNHSILFRATERVRHAFQDVTTHSEFLKDILKHVENSIPNITFDIKAIELARAYRHKTRGLRSSQPRKRSNDITSSLSNYQFHSKSSSKILRSSVTSEVTNPEASKLEKSGVKEIKGEREVLRQIQSPFSKHIDDVLNREGKQKETFIRKASGQKISSKENNENAAKFGNVPVLGVASKEKRSIF